MASMFFFNDTATTEIYTLSLHDALPISWSITPTRAAVLASIGFRRGASCRCPATTSTASGEVVAGQRQDRESTRLNSSHAHISYGVFCLKKKDNIDASHAQAY